MTAAVDTRPEIKHGTTSGQREHYRRGTRPCEPCRVAYNLAYRKPKELHLPPPTERAEMKRRAWELEVQEVANAQQERRRFGLGDAPLPADYRSVYVEYLPVVMEGDVIEAQLRRGEQFFRLRVDAIEQIEPDKWALKVSLEEDPTKKALIHRNSKSRIRIVPTEARLNA